jgi:hypothetical protein
MNGGAAGRAGMPAAGGDEGPAALGDETSGFPSGVGRGTEGAGESGIVAAIDGAGANAGLGEPTTRGADAGVGVRGGAAGGEAARDGAGAGARAGAGGAIVSPPKDGMPCRAGPAPTAANSSRASVPAPMVITPPHTEHRARTLVPGTLAGSTRNTERHSGQATFMTSPRLVRPV